MPYLQDAMSWSVIVAFPGHTCFIWNSFVLKNGEKTTLEHFFLAHQIGVFVVFTHVRYFYLTYPYQP